MFSLKRITAVSFLRFSSPHRADALFQKSILHSISLALFIVLTVLCGTGASQNNIALPAFPGAEGAAKFTSGGRGGDVYIVTNTNTSGEGSLPYGIEKADGPRTIVFNTGGVIHFEDDYEFRDKQNLTIAGQTAPGDGITLRFDQGGFRITNCEDIIVTHLRIENGSDEGRDDLLRTNGSKNIILSHLSIRWGSRGNFVGRPDGPLTVQYLINAEPTDRQLAGWFGHMRQERGVFSHTIHKNLGIHQAGRLNMFQAGRFEFINNVTYNGMARRPDLGPYYIMSRPWHGTRESELGPQLFDANIIGNVMIDGNNPPAATFGFGRSSRVYIEGNKRDRNASGSFTPEPADNDFFESEVPCGDHRGDEFAHVRLPLDLRMSEYQHTRAVSARQAYIDVLSRSGASAARDRHDHRYVRDVMNKTGGHASSLDDIPGGAFQEPDKGEPAQISAEDGIPDYWKVERGLLADVAYHQVFASNGYTYLEKYLHWLMRRSIPPEELETEKLVIYLTDGNGAQGVMVVTLEQETHRMDWLQFDLSIIEPGMINDAYLELSIRNSRSTRYRVYGLDHDHPGAQVSRDNLIFLGELENAGEGQDGIRARLTNPNLAVFLNLTMYHQDQPDSELVTLLFEPLNGSTADFDTMDSPRDGFSPRLILDAVSK